MAHTVPSLDKSKVIVGRIGTAHGVKGWLKIHSFTEPRENILNYKPWLIKKRDAWQTVEVINVNEHANHMAVQFKGCNDRDAAQLLTGADIIVAREQLPKLGSNEYYWTDLAGLTVSNTGGIVLGKVDYLMETGSNDVLVVKGAKQYLIPFLLNQFILTIDLANKTMLVDWDADF